MNQSQLGITKQTTPIAIQQFFNYPSSHWGLIVQNPLESHALLPNQSNWLQFSKHSDSSISVPKKKKIYIYIYFFFETFYVQVGDLKPGNNCYKHEEMPFDIIKIKKISKKQKIFLS